MFSTFRNHLLGWLGNKFPQKDPLEEMITIAHASISPVVNVALYLSQSGYPKPI